MGSLVNLLGDSTNSDEGTGQVDFENSCTASLPGIEAQGSI